MATMNRNVNLEEINSDAFMGIPFLNYQTVFQKGIFIGSIIVGIGLCFVSIFFLDLGANVAVLLTLLPLIPGIAFGCNYNQDLSLLKYLKLILFKPSNILYSKSTEDLLQLRNAADRIKQEEELKQREAQKASPEQQRKLLLKLIIGIIAFFIFMAVIIFIIMQTKTDSIHHTVVAACNFGRVIL